MLPCPAYTLPERGAAPLNLASKLPETANATDLGPKTYIAYGRTVESDGDQQQGDSVTKLHQDMSDAVNVLLHVQRDEGEASPHVRSGAEEAVTPE